MRFIFSTVKCTTGGQKVRFRLYWLLSEGKSESVLTRSTSGQSVASPSRGRPDLSREEIKGVGEKLRSFVTYFQFPPRYEGIPSTFLDSFSDDLTEPLLYHFDLVSVEILPGTSWKIQIPTKYITYFGLLQCAENTNLCLNIKIGPHHCTWTPGQGQ